MSIISKKLYENILETFPILLLFIIVLTSFDLSLNFIFNISFNFVYILIFFWVLKKPEALGFGFIFLAGIINDVLLNLPIGITSINYMLLCIIASFLRGRTLVPKMWYDWLLFLPSILIVNSIYFINLSLIFELPIIYLDLMINSFSTFIIYPLFSVFFEKINRRNVKKEDD